MNRSNELLRGIFEHSHDGIYVLDVEKNRIVDANAAACRILGYSRDELLEMSFASVHPGREEMLADLAAEVLERGSGWTDQLSCTTKSGGVVFTEISASAFQAEGKQYIVAMLRDVTTRHETETELRRLASFPEDNPNPLIEITTDGVISYANSKAKADFPGLEERGASHPLVDGAVEALGDEQAITREIQVGDSWFEQSIKRIEGAGIIRVFAHDLTERKKAEQYEHQTQVLEVA